ncbi:PilZ domain-containing protein [Priestia endophytica]|uniref:PilZ domain-containing protein n=1 Tax=Priestia endophytica TaxID=135735 RepID=UPI000F537C1B|nr:PilZ domain-containing protein [Priestia endophytica]MED4070382.1 PilZ domain-containing protein [Priestia endophytica]
MNVWLVFEHYDQYYHIQTKAEVINILPSHVEKQHNVGVKFLTLGVKEQEALIRYTLEVQRELKRKGLL